MDYSDIRKHHIIKDLMYNPNTNVDAEGKDVSVVNKERASVRGLQCLRCALAESPVIRLSAAAFHFPLCPRSVALRSLNCVFA